MGIRVVKIKGSRGAGAGHAAHQDGAGSVGDGIALRLDPNAAWDVPSTLRTMRQVEDCHLQLLEQPLPGWDLKGMAHIRSQLGIPIEADRERLDAPGRRPDRGGRRGGHP
jgi:L-alanine-DL-glutamate epimerase-like enolase superfamily enzyme